jgi:hypothetical protein
MEDRMNLATRASCMLAALVLAGCATALPPSYRTLSAGDGAPTGPVPQLAASGSLVYAMGEIGLYRRDPAGRWDHLVLPGGVVPGDVTALAAAGEDLALGTRENGVHVLRQGSWTAASRSNGALPDDEVFCLAWDAGAGGSAGRGLWAGTRSGLAVMGAEGGWEPFTPAGRWLGELSPFTPPAEEEVFVMPGAEFGLPGGDKGSFHAPVTAIAFGEAGIALGNDEGRVALLRRQGGLAVFRPEQLGRINALLLEKGALWAGTATGLYWAGSGGLAQGRPYPSWRGLVHAFPLIFGSRDARLFDFRWYQAGYNTAPVIALATDARRSLWTAFRAERAVSPVIEGHGTPPLPSGGFRRYPAPAEYMARGAELPFERYGSALGIEGEEMSLVAGDEGVWMGSRKGIFRVR